MFYKLVNKIPVPCKAEDFSKGPESRVGEDSFKIMDDEVRVSTVFLGVDHNHFRGGIPILFETMIFGGRGHEEQVRYRSWDAAAVGHTIAVEYARGIIDYKEYNNRINNIES